MPLTGHPGTGDKVILPILFRTNSVNHTELSFTSIGSRALKVRLPRATSLGSEVDQSAPGKGNSKNFPLKDPFSKHCPVPKNPIFPACFSANTTKLLFWATAIPNGLLIGSVGSDLSMMIVATALSGITIVARKTSEKMTRSRLSICFPVIRLKNRPDGIKAARKHMLKPRKYQTGSKRITEVRLYL